MSDSITILPCMRSSTAMLAKGLLVHNLLLAGRVLVLHHLAGLATCIHLTVYVGGHVVRYVDIAPHVLGALVVGVHLVEVAALSHRGGLRLPVVSTVVVELHLLLLLERVLGEMLGVGCLLARTSTLRNSHLLLLNLAVAASGHGNSWCLSPHRSAVGGGEAAGRGRVVSGTIPSPPVLRNPLLQGGIACLLLLLTLAILSTIAPPGICFPLVSGFSVLVASPPIVPVLAALLILSLEVWLQLFIIHFHVFVVVSSFVGHLQDGLSSSVDDPGPGHSSVLPFL